MALGREQADSREQAALPVPLESGEEAEGALTKGARPATEEHRPPEALACPRAALGASILAVLQEGLRVRRLLEAVVRSEAQHRAVRPQAAPQGAPEPTSSPLVVCATTVAARAHCRVAVPALRLGLSWRHCWSAPSVGHDVNSPWQRTLRIQPKRAPVEAGLVSRVYTTPLH
jgi:hypothetical protein